MVIVRYVTINSFAIHSKKEIDMIIWTNINSPQVHITVAIQ